MATIVKGDLYEAIDGKLHEIKRQMRQKDGYGFDPKRLDSALQAVIEGRFEAVGGQPPLLTLAVAELIPEYTDENGNKKKWGVVEDVSPFEFKVKDLEFISFLEKGEDYIGGEEMRKRAVGLKANLGLADAKYLLDHKAEIPAKLRGKKYIVLPGTVLRDSVGDLLVPYLGWRGGRWVLDFNWVDNAFNGYDVLARSK